MFSQSCSIINHLLRDAGNSECYIIWVKENGMTASLLLSLILLGASIYSSLVINCNETKRYISTTVH